MMMIIIGESLPNTYQILNEISENEEFEDAFTFHEKNILYIISFLVLEAV